MQKRMHINKIILVLNRVFKNVTQRRMILSLNYHLLYSISSIHLSPNFFSSGQWRSLDFLWIVCLVSPVPDSILSTSVHEKRNTKKNVTFYFKYIICIKILKHFLHWGWSRYLCVLWFCNLKYEMWRLSPY